MGATSSAALRAAIAALACAAIAGCGSDTTSDDAAAETAADAGATDAAAEPASASDAPPDDAVAEGTPGDAPVGESAPATDATGAPASGCGAAIAPGNTTHAITSGGLQRAYTVHVPTGYDGATPRMLVLVLHGWLGTADQIRTATGFDAAADVGGFLAVYPQGTDDSWNAGGCCGSAPTNHVDDVGFVRDLLDELEREYCVDPKRVFVAGFSNGGMMSERLACELADRVAAIGPVAGPLAMSTCNPSRPVPILELHGTADPVVWYGGAPLSGTPAVETNVAGWVTRDGCTDATPAQVYQHGAATCTRWSQCADGAAVEFCKIDNGGHQWPGGQPIGVGTLSNDLDATAAIVEFFAAHPMP